MRLSFDVDELRQTFCGIRGRETYYVDANDIPAFSWAFYKKSDELQPTEYDALIRLYTGVSTGEADLTTSRYTNPPPI